jgi:two-component system, chemotaxis family, response regulator Rcp1
MKTTPDKPLEILLVEDNRAEARLVQEALAEMQLHASLHVAADGVDAMQFLHRTGTHAGARRPDLVLLDLNMPRKDGRAVLREIKEDETLRGIPVIVLSTSTSEDDIARAYQLSANCYIPKPVDMDKFIGVVKAIQHFWHTTAALPPKS